MVNDFVILQDIFKDELFNQNLVLEPTTILAEIPGWDSVNLSCVIVGVETRFGITFTADQMDRLETAGDFLTVIRANASG